MFQNLHVVYKAVRGYMELCFTV